MFSKLLTYFVWLLALCGCGVAVGWFYRSEVSSNERMRIRAERSAWEEREGPCQDSATLLATTAGSPNGHTCPNRRHRMRIQIASAPSNEEFGAVAFCECVRAADAGVQP